jgi:FRG domain
MRGQWKGRYNGSIGGLIIVDIDELSSHYQGVAYLINETNKTLPSTAAWFRTKNKDKNFQFRTDLILPIDPVSGIPTSPDKIKDHYSENVVVPKYADVVGSREIDSLKLSWVTDIGTKGSCTLPQSMADKPSELVAQNKEWGAYKEYVASLEGKRYLFRGQNRPWRLRTSFHRANRADLTRFLNEDIQMLHKHLSARTKHVFNLEIPNENGAFFNLVQHHGYPTPLLDWTYSPYVAAFFAYRGISNDKAAEAVPADMVRIHVFDQAQWKADWSQLHMLATAGPHLSIGEFLAIENERMIPQQAASTVTNVDDIESYIKSKESNGKKYLWAIDLPIRDRKQVVRELGYMGITAGSLFPGLDGACEELRERNFEI